MELGEFLCCRSVAQPVLTVPRGSLKAQSIWRGEEGAWKGEDQAAYQCLHPVSPALGEICLGGTSVLSQQLPLA